MCFDKESRSKPKDKKSSFSGSHLRDSSVANAQTQWEQSMKQKTDLSKRENKDFHSNGKSYIINPDEFIEEVKSDIPQRIPRTGSSYSLAGNEQKDLWEKEKNVMEPIFPASLISIEDYKIENEDPFINHTLPKEENSQISDVKSFSENKDTPSNENEILNKEINDKSKTTIFYSESDSSQDISFVNNQSHLRDSSVKAAQDQWQQEMSRIDNPNHSIFKDSIKETRDTFFGKSKENFHSGTSQSDEKESVFLTSSSDGKNQSHLRDSQAESEQNKWNEEMHSVFSQKQNPLSNTMDSFRFLQNEQSSLENKEAPLQAKDGLRNTKDISESPVSTFKEYKVSRPIKDKEYKHNSFENTEHLPNKEALKELNKKIVKDIYHEAQNKESFQSKKSHLRDSATQSEQEKWEQQMRQKMESDSFSTKTTIKKTEKEDFFVSELDSHKKDYSSHTASDTSKEVLEKENLSKSKVKEIDKYFYKSHLRDSVTQAEQNLWEEKMKERKSNSFRKRDVIEKVAETPVLKDKKSEFKEVEKKDVSKKGHLPKEKSRKQVKRVKGDSDTSLEKKEKESLEDIIKKRNETQKKALVGPSAYTLEKISRFSTNGFAKILAKQKQILKNEKDFLWRSSAAQTDTGRGIKEGADNIKPFLNMAIDSTKRTLAMSIIGNTSSDEKFQKAYEGFKKAFNAIEDYKYRMEEVYCLGTQKYKNLIHVDPTKTMSREEWRTFQKDLRHILRERGLGDFSANPMIMKLQIMKAIRAGRLTGEEAEILKVLSGRIAEIGNLNGRTKSYHMMRFARRKMHKYGRQEATMNAVFMTKAFVQHSANIARNALLTVKKAAFLVKNAAKYASLAAAKASAKISETKIAKKVSDKLPEGVKATHTEIKKQKARFKKAQKKVTQKKNRIRDSIDVVIDKVPRPIKATKMRYERAKEEFFSFITRGKYNPLRYIAKAFSAVEQIKTTLVLVALGFVLFYIIIVALILIIAAMCGRYDMNTNKLKTNEYCLKKIEQLYQEQQSSLASYDSGGAYRNVTIKKEDKKSNEMYQGEMSFKETTNTAEMMSMAQVYFDFKLDDVKEDTLGAYLSGLYYGTHTTDIKETAHYTEDEDGQKILDYTDATITVTTYYFDDIFDCALSSSSMGGSESAMAGQSVDIPQTYAQMWTVTKYDAINWGYDCGKLYRAWKQGGSKWDDGFACLEINGKSYRFIAVLEKFGKVGDYMTVQLDNGYNINCIVADTKRASECPNGWGHMEGNTLSVVEWEVSTSYFSHYGNPGSGYGKELKGRKAAKLINGGSYFKNPSGPRFTDSPVLDTTTGITANVNTFVTLLNKYSDFIKQNSAYVKYGNSNNVRTYAQAKSNVADHEKSTINCVSPVMWGLKEMGLLSKSTNFYSTTSGRWIGKGDKLNEKMKTISSGELIGMNVVEAAKKGLLKPGDIIANKTFAHTFVYVSYDKAKDNIVVYEAGGNARDLGYGKVGCGPFTIKQYKNLKIASILRWR